MTQEQLNHAGGHAFPMPGTGHTGMTLREYLAGQALAGYLAMHADPGVLAPKADVVASSCVKYADAVIAEIKRTTPPKRAEE